MCHRSISSHLKYFVLATAAVSPFLFQACTLSMVILMAFDVKFTGIQMDQCTEKALYVSSIKRCCKFEEIRDCFASATIPVSSFLFAIISIIIINVNPVWLPLCNLRENQMNHWKAKLYMCHQSITLNVNRLCNVLCWQLVLFIPSFFKHEQFLLYSTANCNSWTGWYVDNPKCDHPYRCHWLGRACITAV